MHSKLSHFLGYAPSWWIAVRAVMRKAGLDGPDELAARLGVTAPPFWSAELDAKRRRELEADST